MDRLMLFYRSESEGLSTTIRSKFWSKARENKSGSKIQDPAGGTRGSGSRGSLVGVVAVIVDISG